MNDTEWRKYAAIHEAGHAIVAMYLGKDVHEIRIDVPEGDPEMPDGGGYCLNYKPRVWRSWHAASCLGGVLACAIHCRDMPGFAEWNNWGFCHEDMRLFNEDRGGMTYRQARRIALGIIRECEPGLLALAAILERDGIANHQNCGDVSFVNMVA